MTTHRFINWMLATLIALGMSSAYLLDGPDDIATAQAVAEDLQDATKLVAADAHSMGARP